MSANDNNPFGGFNFGGQQGFCVTPMRPATATSGKARLWGALVTVTGGIVLAVTVAISFRRPKEHVVRLPAPPPVIVPKEVVRYRDRVVPAPAPPPVVMRTEPAREPPPEPPPPPKVELPPPQGQYDGAWKIVGKPRPLPAFILTTTATGIKGSYAPMNDSGLHAFTAGPVVDDELEFSVTDRTGMRIWFAMKFESDTVAKVWKWRLLEDVLADKSRADARPNLTPLQRQVLRRALDAEMIGAGRRFLVGTFKRAKDPGQEGK